MFWACDFFACTRFSEIADRKGGDKCYTNSRSLVCFKKGLKIYVNKKLKF